MSVKSIFQTLMYYPLRRNIDPRDDQHPMDIEIEIKKVMIISIKTF